jgi:Abnormal spindle-like microcephaly-assoc'd, ASPM-SPD-2-Hydin
MAGPTGASTASCPQSAGVTSMPNTSLLTTTLVVPITCPAGHAGCNKFSNPILFGDVISQNRSFYIGVGNRGAGNLNQQNLVSLYSAFTSTPAPTQASTGACSATGVTYWDLGVRGDRTLTGHESGSMLNPVYSFVGTGGGGANNSAAAPGVISEYCNGSRVPPECTLADGCGGLNGFGVPPGIADAVTPNPLFSLVPSATVDEGNNWINVSWGPLSLTNPSVTGGANNNYGGGAPLGNYSITAASPAFEFIPCNNSNAVGQGCRVTPVSGLTITLPRTDFFGNPRPDPGTTGSVKHVDVGAVEIRAGAAGAAVASVSPTSLAFGNVPAGTTSASQTLTLSNTGTASLTGISETFSAGSRFSRLGGAAGGTCAGTLAAGATCTINVVFAPNAVGPQTATMTINASVAVTGSPVSLSGTGVAAVGAASLTPTSHAYPNQTRSATPCGTADLGCLTAPLQVFTLTNTGNVPLTGIAQGVLGGANPTEFNVDRLLSTCGPAGGGQLLGQTTLAPGAACVITVAFHPLTSQPTGAQAATISVTDAAGTQTSTLTGTAQ